jgi:hypothetical protein
MESLLPFSVNGQKFQVKLIVSVPVVMLAISRQSQRVALQDDIYGSSQPFKVGGERIHFDVPALQNRTRVLVVGLHRHVESRISLFP